MNQPIWFLMFLICSITACTSGGSSFECKEGICIYLEIQGPVKALEPTKFVISIKTEKEINELPVGLSFGPGIAISDIEKIPESVKSVSQDITGIVWQIDTKGGEEYFFSGYIVLSKPTASYGVFSYLIFAYFSQPTFGRVADSTRIFLDAEGNQVEESKAKSLLQTGVPAPTSPPDLTIVPDSPFPTMIQPSETPSPSMTPTSPVYPAPDNPVATLPGYPSP